MGQNRKGDIRRVVGSLESWNKAECHWLKRWTKPHVSRSLEIGNRTSGVELSGVGLHI